MKVLRTSALIVALGSVAAGSVLNTTPARASAALLVDAESGKVLQAENATYPWYPASLSKLMTLYVTLSALRDHRITPDTLFTVTRNAWSQAPTKMGFPIGTQVTVDNALKMMMVKSANDMAVLLAEGIDGSIDKFAEEMTLTAQSLGMTQTNFVNPNGLPADGQITSARDLAILARALIRQFPQNSFYWHIPAIRWGKRVVRNYNPLLGRYPGTDGMKTGFICAGGFNLVATATRGNKQLIAVVLGASSGAARAVKAAEMLESGFSQNPLSWLIPSLGKVDQLQPINTAPLNLKDEMCGRHRRHEQEADSDDEGVANASVGDTNPQFSILLSALRAPSSRNLNLLNDQGTSEPILVYTGPTRVPGMPVPPEPTIASKSVPHHKKLVTAAAHPAAKPARARPAAKPKTQ